MAVMFETSQNKGSDLLYDICCSVCEDDGINKEGLFHCQKCSKTYCDECVLMHNKLLKTHSITAKCDGDNWLVSTTLEDILELCEEHSTEKLTMFCEDHEKLLCHVCHLRNHKLCRQVVLLADKVKSATQRTNVPQMTKTIEQLQKNLQDMVDREKQNIKSLQASYELVVNEVLDVRRQINVNLDRLQQHTLKELEIIHASLNASLEDNTKRCLQFIAKLKGYGTKLKDNIPPERSFISLKRCLDQTAAADALLKSMNKNDGTDIKLQPNRDLIQCITDSTDLGKITSRICEPHNNGDPNNIVSFLDRSQYNVRTATDKNQCSLFGMCETSNENLVILDRTNRCLKLLNQAYKVIDHVELPSYPLSMCNISSFEMAVTVDTEIHLIRVDNGKIIKMKVLKMNHICNGIAHHDADLFVTSGTVLYQYTMDGRLVKKIYEDTSTYNTVEGVGVSPDGKRIYVTDWINGRLVTLTRDGAVTAQLQDPAFKHTFFTCNIHVAVKGQVFVFGDTSITQVDTDGKKVVNTITLDVSCPRSVYFNQDKRKLLIGFLGNDNILEFKTKTILSS